MRARRCRQRCSQWRGEGGRAGPGGHGGGRDPEPSRARRRRTDRRRATDRRAAASRCSASPDQRAARPGAFQLPCQESSAGSSTARMGQRHSLSSTPLVMFLTRLKSWPAISARHAVSSARLDQVQRCLEMTFAARSVPSVRIASARCPAARGGHLVPKEFLQRQPGPGSAVAGPALGGSASRIRANGSTAAACRASRSAGSSRRPEAARRRWDPRRSGSLAANGPTTVSNSPRRDRRPRRAACEVEARRRA